MRTTSVTVDSPLVESGRGKTLTMAERTWRRKHKFFKQKGGFLSLLTTQSGTKAKNYVGPLSILCRIILENRPEAPPTRSNIEAISPLLQLLSALLWWKRILLMPPYAHGTAPIDIELSSFGASMLSHPSPLALVGPPASVCGRKSKVGCPWSWVCKTDAWKDYSTNIWWSQEWK